MTPTIESVFDHLQKISKSNLSDKEWSREVRKACEKLFEITRDERLINNTMWFVALGKMWNEYIINKTEKKTEERTDIL